jgi:hypothetical protein
MWQASWGEQVPKWRGQPVRGTEHSWFQCWNEPLTSGTLGVLWEPNLCPILYFSARKYCGAVYIAFKCPWLSCATPPPTRTFSWLLLDPLLSHHRQLLSFPAPSQLLLPPLHCPVLMSKSMGSSRWPGVCAACKTNSAYWDISRSVYSTPTFLSILACQIQSISEENVRIKSKLTS